MFTLSLLSARYIWLVETENFFIFYFIFNLGFFSRTFTIYRTTGEGGYVVNFSLPLPSASRTLRHYPGNYCRELTSAHSQQPDTFGFRAQVVHHKAKHPFLRSIKRKNILVRNLMFRGIQFYSWVNIRIIFSLIDMY